MKISVLTFGVVLLIGCTPAGNNSPVEISENDQNFSKQIKINGKPDSVIIDLKKTAVIVVDMQNDFCSVGGLMDRIGVDVTAVKNIINPISNLLATARKAGIPVIYLKMGYLADLSDLGANKSEIRNRFYGIVGDTTTSSSGIKGRILIRETWNTDIITELAPEVNDIVINKTRFSGFYETQLDATLKRLGIKYLIVTGCTTSVCVESTVRDAMFRDYISIVLEDCTSEPVGSTFDRTNHEASLYLIQSELGWVSNSSEILSAIQE